MELRSYFFFASAAHELLGLHCSIYNTSVEFESFQEVAYSARSSAWNIILAFKR